MKNYTYKQELRYINLFWLGFFIYTLSFVQISGLLNPNYKFFNLLQVLSLSILVYSFVRSSSFDFEDIYLKNLFIFYCLWILIIIIRGISFDYTFLKKMLFDPYRGILLYLAPMVLLVPLKLINLRKIFKIIPFFSLCFVAYIFLFRARLFNIGSEDARTLLEYLAKTLSLPAGFVLLSYSYHSIKKNILSIIILLLTLFFAIIQARRGLIFTTALILIFSISLLLYNNKRNVSSVLLTIIFFALAFTFLTNFIIQDNKFFKFIKERKNEDSRGELEVYYYADMDAKDWIIGRGISGLIAAPLNVDDENPDAIPGYRDGIESDYLNIILKGGIISLTILLLITIPAIIKGLLYSKNTISKAAALWIILWILDLYPTTVTTFTLNYLLVWISVSICYSTEIRYMNDVHIKAYLSMPLKSLIRNSQHETQNAIAR
jgi:hypothetical protein